MSTTKQKFNIQDEVKVVDVLKGFSAYTEFVVKYGSKEDCVKFRAGEKCPCGFSGKITAIHKHIEFPDCYSDIAIISDESKCYVVEVSGLELLNNSANKKVTIKEFYEWAVKHNVENLPFGVGIQKEFPDEELDYELCEFDLNNIDVNGSYWDKGVKVLNNFVWAYIGFPENSLSKIKKT